MEITQSGEDNWHRSSILYVSNGAILWFSIRDFLSNFTGSIAGPPLSSRRAWVSVSDSSEDYSSLFIFQCAWCACLVKDLPLGSYIPRTDLQFFHSLHGYQPPPSSDNIYRTHNSTHQQTNSSRHSPAQPTRSFPSPDLDACTEVSCFAVLSGLQMWNWEPMQKSFYVDQPRNLKLHTIVCIQNSEVSRSFRAQTNP